MFFPHEHIKVVYDFLMTTRLTNVEYEKPFFAARLIRRKIRSRLGCNLNEFYFFYAQIFLQEPITTKLFMFSKEKHCSLFIYYILHYIHI